MTKVPVNPSTGTRASSTDRSTWSSYLQALGGLSRWPAMAGVGFMFASDDPFAGVDLDDCINPETGMLKPWAQKVVASLNSYTEVSPSGTGLKIFIQATNRCGHNRRKYEDGEIEIYSQARYFTVTGDHWPGTPQTVEPRQQQLDDLCAMLWPAQPQRPDQRDGPSLPIDVDDQELLRCMLAAKNGDAIRRLYDGDTSAHGDDDSAADMALCSHLAFWTGRDAQRMDRLFRGSGLYREKWDRADYRARTIAKAIADCREVYRPGQPKSAGSVAQDGPCGVQLRAIEVTHTPKRHTGRFEVWVDGQDTKIELTATDTSSGVRTAMPQLITALSAARPQTPVTDDEQTQLRAWLATVLTRRNLVNVSRRLEAQHAPVDETAKPTDGTMYEIALAHMRETLELAFVDPAGNIWSERLGRMMSRSDFTNHVDPVLLKKIGSANNYAEPTISDPTKPIKHLQQELKPVWTVLSGSLPPEVGATNLGPQSKAAQVFRDTICRLWQVPETWMKFDLAGGTPAHVERMSLASRVRELMHMAESRAPRWDRVLKGVNAFYRIEVDGQGQPRVWLGMRADLCRGEIKGVELPGVHSQHELSMLINRYGLADTTGCVDRLREDHEQRRLCVLSRALTDYLIHCEDDEGATPCVTDQTVVVVTEGQTTLRVDTQTGEVIE